MNNWQFDAVHEDLLADLREMLAEYQRRGDRRKVLALQVSERHLLRWRDDLPGRPLRPRPAGAAAAAAARLALVAQGPDTDAVAA